MGKRLCGKIGGGPNAYADWANANGSQWYNACSCGGTETYPYGNAHQSQTCNGTDHSAAVVPVGSMTNCRSQVQGYEGVYDLVGTYVSGKMRAMQGLEVMTGVPLAGARSKATATTCCARTAPPRIVARRTAGSAFVVALTETFGLCRCFLLTGSQDRGASAAWGNSRSGSGPTGGANAGGPTRLWTAATRVRRLGHGLPRR